MTTTIGKTVRLSDFIDSRDNRCLLLDTTIASCLGATPGLEDLTLILRKINHILDGLIVNPGTAEHYTDLLGGKQRAAPIIRVDWTNAHRNKDFCLQTSSFERVMISNAEDALKLGASAVVVSFFMGFNDEAEAENIESLSYLARECYPLSLPLMVDIQTNGEKVGKNNFDESVKLGVSFMHELGADVLIIPDCEVKTYSTISNWIKIPVLVRLNAVPKKGNVDAIFDNGLAGIVLSEKVLEYDDYINNLKKLKSVIHNQ